MNSSTGISQFFFSVYCIFLVFVLGISESVTSQNIRIEALRAHTAFLANDLLEGRGTASRGEALAAQYLISQLREYGLEPIPGRSSDFRMPVPLTAYHFDRSKTQLQIFSPDSSHILTYPDFYHPGGAPEAFKNFSGQLLFAGPTPNALSALENIQDLTGYVVVLCPPWTDIGYVEAELKQRGAEGAIEIVPNAFYDRLRVVRGPTRYALPTEVDAPDNQSQLPTIIIGPEGSRSMGLWEDVTSHQKISTAVELSTRIEVTLTITEEQKTGYNVAGFLEGTESAESDSLVVFMAHYDHVGRGNPTDGDDIWNGFIDNSTGTAMLLEIARVLSSDPPPHSVLFLFTTAEEQGLLGSIWFVHDSPIHLGKIKAVINLDGGAPPPDIKQWTIAVQKESRLANAANNTLQQHGRITEMKPVISDSDHWPFHRGGVPSLFLYPGRQVTTEHIHTAKDEWQPDFPFEGLADYAETALLIHRALYTP